MKTSGENVAGIVSNDCFSYFVKCVSCSYCPSRVCRSRAGFQTSGDCGLLDGYDFVNLSIVLRHIIKTIRMRGSLIWKSKISDLDLMSEIKLLDGFRFVLEVFIRHSFVYEPLAFASCRERAVQSFARDKTFVVGMMISGSKICLRKNVPHAFRITLG